MGSADLAASVNYSRAVVPVHVFNMSDDDVLTWNDVRRRLTPKGRGAPYQLAQRLGMNSSYFYRKLKGAAPLTVEQARVVRSYLGESSDDPAAAPQPASSRRRLPVYGYAAPDGEETVALNEGQVIDWLELPMGIELGPGEYFVVRALGSSMEPRIFPGENLVVRRAYPPAKGKDVVVEFTDGTGLVKTYQGQRDGHVFLEQYNPAKSINADATRVRALHAVAFRL